MRAIQEIDVRSHRQVSIASRVSALVFVALLLTCCAVRLIGDYDEKIDTGVSDVQQKAELYFAKLQSDPNTPYDQSFYDDIYSRLAVLRSRASSLAKYHIIAEQIDNLKTQFDTLQRLDKGTSRPFPKAAVTSAESAIAVSVESILKLELALKRGVKSPPALTTTTK